MASLEIFSAPPSGKAINDGRIRAQTEIIIVSRLPRLDPVLQASIHSELQLSNRMRLKSLKNIILKK